MRLLVLILAVLSVTVAAQGAVSFQFDEETGVWRLDNGVLAARFRLHPETKLLRFEELRRSTGGVWTAAEAVSPVDLEFGEDALNAQTAWRLVRQSTEAMDRGGWRQRVVLWDLAARFELTLDWEMWEGHSVLRQSARVRNLQGHRATATKADLFPFAFATAASQRFRALGVNQWLVAPRGANFEPFEQELSESGEPFALDTGSGGVHCAWLALRDPSDRGLAFGLEFNGRAQMAVSHSARRGVLRLSAPILSLNHPIEPGETFEIPATFLATFRGDWDEAGFRTQRFTEQAIAVPLPDDAFPYVAWDSWGYQKDIHEESLRRNADIAAALGMELFIVDLGWARAMGDWEADPEKFPSGLRALSDYVHSLGMKFGLHFAFGEAEPDSPVLEGNDDWTSSETYHYHGGVSLCLGHKPARDWVVRQAVAMIDRYNVDWILQDGQNMVKTCTKTTHTHDPRDSNYANSVEGLDALIEEVQRQRPHVLWENCANGGSMMTFKMTRNYVTSITNDASGARDSRQAVFGATLPFSPRYADRYMPESRLDSYTTRSFMFGGPWIFMNRLPQMSPEDLDRAASEIKLFKSMRRDIRDGKVFRLSARPATNQTDAIQSYNAATDTAIAIVTRDVSLPTYQLRFQGLTAANTYRVRRSSGELLGTFTGAQLAETGVTIELPEVLSAAVVWAEPANRAN